MCPPSGHMAYKLVRFISLRMISLFDLSVDLRKSSVYAVTDEAVIQGTKHD